VDAHADRLVRAFSTLAEPETLAETAGIDAGRIPECLSGGYADGPMLHA
jgi:hypothetical protein